MITLIFIFGLTPGGNCGTCSVLVAVAFFGGGGGYISHIIQLTPRAERRAEKQSGEPWPGDGERHRGRDSPAFAYAYRRPLCLPTGLTLRASPNTGGGTLALALAPPPRSHATALEAFTVLSLHFWIVGHPHP